MKSRPGNFGHCDLSNMADEGGISVDPILLGLMGLGEASWEFSSSDVVASPTLTL